MEIIRLSDVKKGFKGNTLFSHVSFSIEKGTITGFSGHNGCGKSVLFKLISGLYKPDCGQIFVRNKEIGNNYNYPENMGILIDSPGFIEIYSGFKNLRYLADIQNKIDDKRIVDTMELLGLSPNNKSMVKNYSLGMKLKLGIAQAIMEDQDIIILDEPFSALDAESCSKVKLLLLKLKEKGATILITSHNQDDLTSLCDSIYVFKNQSVCLETN